MTDAAAWLLQRMGISAEDAETLKTGIFSMIRDAAEVRDKVRDGERDVRALAQHFHERLTRLEEQQAVAIAGIETLLARSRAMLPSAEIKPNGADHGRDDTERADEG